MQHAGLEGEEVYLLLEDRILEKQGSIDTINALLCSGEVSYETFTARMV